MWLKSFHLKCCRDVIICRFKKNSMILWKCWAGCVTFDLVKNHSFYYIWYIIICMLYIYHNFHHLPYNFPFSLINHNFVFFFHPFCGCCCWMRKKMKRIILGSFHTDAQWVPMRHHFPVSWFSTKKIFSFYLFIQS